MTSRGALARHPLAIVGAVLATVTAVLFIALLIAAFAGLLTNPYAGMVVFVAIPLAFVVGLALIPAGMWLQQRKLRRDPTAASADWPVLDFRRASVRRTALAIAALTAVNVVILLLAGYGGLHWMESPSFCGQVCHTPMRPQFVAWGGAPHARVACVACHIGEGPAALVHAKLSGVRQLIQVATHSYPKPIPPGAKMPPGAQAQTCVSCHRADRDIGDRIHVVREYADDEANTETATVLLMHVGNLSSSGRAIHRHTDSSRRIEYVTNDEGQTIPYVRVTNAAGQVKEYLTPDATGQVMTEANRRTMDCIDCHNTVGHPIAPTPEAAVDQAIAASRVSRDLPYVRREGVKLMKAVYAGESAGVSAIESGLRDFYQSQNGSFDQESLARSVAALQEVYRRNVSPAMNVSWGAYPSNKGHLTATGCFRCHDDTHAAKDGSTISADCEYCHKQVEQP